jgi:hypothetical protein
MQDLGGGCAGGDELMQLEANEPELGIEREGAGAGKRLEQELMGVAIDGCA